jgi:hypothetical protein
MAVEKALKGLAIFLFFFALAIMIPDLTVEWFNFRQFSLEIKMLFVFSSGIMGLAYLFWTLKEVSS